MMVRDMDSADGFKYKAFISYSHRDMKLAKRLHDFLENYHLPTTSCKRLDESERLADLLKNRGKKPLSPVFRDETDLPHGNLTEEIKAALRDSQFIIVLCTIRSAHPNEYNKTWVNEEVEYFKELHGEHSLRNIIPIVHRDTPETKLEDCLPAAIKAAGLFTPDIAAKGRKRTFSDVAAKLLNLHPDSLWDEFRHCERRKRCIIGGVAAAGILFAAYWGYDYYIPHYAYYADYVERHNIPQGLRPLSAEERSRLTCHYRFTTYKHRLIKVECLNSCSMPTSLFNPNPTPTKRPAALSLDYSSEDGKVTTQTYYDTTGKILQVRQVSDNAVTFRIAEKTKGGETKDYGNGGMNFSFGFSVVGFDEAADSISNPVAQLRLERDAATGDIISEKYCNAYGTPIANEIGIWGKTYQRDSAGRPIRCMYLNRAGEQTISTEGIAGEVYTYEPEYGRLGSISYYTIKDGKEIPCLTPENYATIQYTWKNGLLTEESFKDTKGKPCFNENGFSYTCWEYDGGGNTIKLDFKDKQHQPCYNDQKFSTVAYRYDKWGHVSEERFFNTKGAPCTDKDGLGGVRHNHNKQGLLLSQTVLDLKGNPSPGNKILPYATICNQYDSRSNLKEQRYLNAKGEPCNYTAGSHCTTVQRCYNERNKLEWKAFLDAQGKPTPCDTGNTFIKITHEEGETPSETVLLLDAEQKPCFTTLGIAAFKRIYNKNGQPTAYILLGKEGKRPCFHMAFGFASLRKEYDEHGYLAKESFWDENDSPCLNSAGYTAICYHYHDGYVSKKEYYGKDGRRILLPGGYDGERYEYTMGRISKVEYLMNDGEKDIVVNTADGFSVIEYTYDDRGKVTSETYRDSAGKRCHQKFAFSRAVFEYDSRGENLTYEAYFDADDHPLAFNGNYASVKREFDERDGQLLYEAYFGTDGKPVLNNEGYAAIRHERNERGDIVQTTFYDDATPAAPRSDGSFAYTQYTYDEQGNRTSVEFRDHEGNLILCDEQYAKAQYEYDSRGNCTVEQYSDEKGRPCDKIVGSSRKEKTFDDFGHETCIRHYSADGALQLTETFEYNRYGQFTTKSFSGIGWAEPYAVQKISYNAKGRISEILYLDTDGNPTKEGYARRQFLYDEYGNFLDFAFFDADGNPVKASDNDIQNDDAEPEEETDEDGTLKNWVDPLSH